MPYPLFGIKIYGEFKKTRNPNYVRKFRRFKKPEKPPVTFNSKDRKSCVSNQNLISRKQSRKPEISKIKKSLWGFPCKNVEKFLNLLIKKWKAYPLFRIKI